MDNPHMLFRANPPHLPVTVLLLLENSHALSNVWADLRDKCLDRLVGEIYFANPSVPITLSILETSHYGTSAFVPKHYMDYHDGLRDIDFDEDPENRITKGHIHSCIEFLAPAHARGQATSSHFIIVAANPPLEASPDNSTYYGTENMSWVALAHKMGSSNIHCHLVCSSPNDMGSLPMLFEETLRVQGNVEQCLTPPVDLAHAVLRLSARPKYDYYQDIGASLSSPTVVRGGIPRRNSYPLDNFYTETFDEATGQPHTSEGDQPPSLVTQLQQVHGLTKKKVYGTKPSRQPFFRDERVKFRSPPAPLTMPLSIMDSTPSPTNGGRAISQSRLDRMNRVSQAPISSDIHRRQHAGWTRRGSRLSTPEPDHQTWPSSVHEDMPVTPTNMVSSALSSPVSPIPASIPPASVSPIYQIAGPTESSWVPMQPQPSPAPFNPVHSPYIAYTTPPPSQHYTENGYTYETDVPQQPTIVSSTYITQNSAQGPIRTPPPPQMTSQAMHQKPAATTPAARVPSDKLSVLPTSSISKRTAQEDADEERFSFGNDFVAATAALFEAEVLPAYPNYPGMSSGLFTNGNQETLSALPSAQTGELYASRDRRQPVRPMMSMGSNAGPAYSVNVPPQGHGPMMHSHSHPHPHASSVAMDGPAAYSFGVPSYAPSYGSSLTGWAG